MTSAHRVQFGLLLPDMKPWLVCDASGILFRVTELPELARRLCESGLCDDRKQSKFHLISMIGREQSAGCDAKNKE